jgi:CheY-like chemotaxis protein
VAYTLLLADDSTTIQRVIELTFAGEEVRVVTASDGAEAIAMLEKTAPDIVLADVGMPGADGYEIARHMRATPRLAHIPVLLLAGAFESIDPVRVKDAGCQGVLAKPFEPQAVVARVRELLANPSAPAVPAAPDGGAARAESAHSATVARYFEQLDEAFASLAASGQAARRVPGAAGAPTSQSGALSPTVEAPTSPHLTASSAPLADAFAALLQAERAGNESTPALPPPVTAAIDEAMIEEIVRRVLERLGDGAVRPVVAGLVLDVAERLVREEIERIRATIV